MQETQGITGDYQLGIRIRMKKYLLVLFVALLTAYAASASTVSLAWNASASASTNEVINYRVYWGPGAGFYTNYVSAGTNLTVTVSNLMDRRIYYFAATAVNTNGEESVFSNEVSHLLNPLTNVVLSISMVNKPPRAKLQAKLYPNAPVVVWVKYTVQGTQWIALVTNKANASGVWTYTNGNGKSQKYYKIEVTQ